MGSKGFTLEPRLHLCIIFFFLLVRLGFELRALLATQMLHHSIHTSSPFCSGYFGDGGGCPGTDPPDLSLPRGWDYSRDHLCWENTALSRTTLVPKAQDYYYPLFPHKSWPHTSVP
jgi:hypothetical protein